MHFAGHRRLLTPAVQTKQCSWRVPNPCQKSCSQRLLSTYPRAHHRNLQLSAPLLQRGPAPPPATSNSSGATPPELSEEARTRHLAIFVSGGGSNFRAIHAAVLNGQISAQVAVVISDVPTCGGWKYAAEHGIATVAYPASSKTWVNGEQTGVSTEELIQGLKERHQVDYVLLAGYLKLIPEELVRVYKRAMLNIHPALLPNFGGKGFYGSKVHQAVIKSGARFSGPTVHFVDEGYDTGPILAQAVVPVSPTDTPVQLAARVLKEEHRLYPHAVSALVDERITWRADGVPVLWTAS